MPIFEFECPHCQHAFDKLVRSAAAATDVVCPNCGQGQVKKKLSTFSAKMSGGSSSFSASAPSCSTGA